jgi:hypothetical protein
MAVEVRTAEPRPTAMWTVFHVATVAMTFADRRAAVRAWAEFRIHLGLQCNRMTSSTLLIPELHWPSATPCSASAPLLHCNTRLKSTRLVRSCFLYRAAQIISAPVPGANPRAEVTGGPGLFLSKSWAADKSGLSFLAVALAGRQVMSRSKSRCFSVSLSSKSLGAENPNVAVEVTFCDRFHLTAQPYSLSRVVLFCSFNDPKISHSAITKCL